MESAQTITLAIVHSVCALYPPFILSFLIFYLKNKALQSQTFYDKALTMALCHCISLALTYNLVMLVALFCHFNHLWACLTTYSLELITNWYFLVLLFSFVIKTLSIFSTSFNNLTFDETKALWKMEVTTFFTTNLALLLEFSFASDLTKLTVYEVLHVGFEMAHFGTFGKVHELMFGITLIYLVVFLTKLEYDNIRFGESNLFQDGCKSFKIWFRVALVLNFSASLAFVLIPMNISEVVNPWFISVVWIFPCSFVFIPTIFVWSFKELPSLIKSKLCCSQEVAEG